MRVRERERERGHATARFENFEKYQRKLIGKLRERKMHYLPVAIGIRSRAPVFEFLLLILI